MKLTKLLLIGLCVLWSGSASAVTLKDAIKNTKEDIISNSKFALLEQGQTGWGWNLKKDDSGGPTALLDIYQYRFLITSFGWNNPTVENIPILVQGVHVDKLVRWIAPNSSDKVRGIVTGKFLPASVWDALTVSYGPGWDLSKQPQDAITHFVTVNFLLGN